MADTSKRYVIRYTYDDNAFLDWTYATSYETKEAAWGYVQRLAQRALESRTKVLDLSITDQTTGRLLLTMTVDGHEAQASTGRKRLIVARL